MPPKKEEARTSSRSDDIIEAFKDPTVVAAIACALGPFITQAIDAALEKRIGALEAKVLEVKAECGRLKGVVEDQGRRLEEMETYSRAHDLIIRGLPESTYAAIATDSAAMASAADSSASVETAVLNLCNDRLSIPVKLRDISVAHRLKAGKNDTCRPIIVRFTSRRVRDEVFRAKKRLFTPRDSSDGNTAPKVFISEHLTKNATNLFYEARKLVRDKKLTAAWSHKGLINVKFTANVNEKPKVVRCVADLATPAQ